ncbi:MAG: hypothetical protein LIO91_05295 [Bacteroidales bacterium]|nr:hypothetical protein [Bacteroidales bacterium]
MKSFYNLALGAVLALGGLTAAADDFNDMNFYSITPSSGALTVGTEIELYVDDAWGWHTDDSKYEIYFSENGGAYANYYPVYTSGITLVTPTSYSTYLYITFNPEDGIGCGDWTLHVPAGVLGVSAGGNWYGNAEVTIDYSDSGSGSGTSDKPTISITTSDLQASEVAEIPADFVLAVDPATSVLGPEYEGAMIWNTTSGTSYTVTITDEYADWGWGWWKCYIPQAITDAGTWQLIVPAESFENNGNYNDTWTMTWTVTGSSDTPDEPGTSDPVEFYSYLPADNSTYTIGDESMFPGYGTFDEVQLRSTKEVVIVPAVAQNISMFNANEGIYLTTTTSIQEFNGEYWVKINFDAIEKNGEWTLSIPDGAFTSASGESSNMIFLHYTVEGAPDDTTGDFTLSLVTPADGSSLSGFTDGTDDYGSAKIPYIDGTYITVAVENVPSDLYEITGTFTASDGSAYGWYPNFKNVNDDGTRTAVAGWDYPMYAGVDYVLTITAYSTVGKAVIAQWPNIATYHGTTPVVNNVSDVTFTVSPEPGSVVTAENGAEIVITFSAPVNCDQAFASEGGQGVEVVNATTVSNADRTVWTLTLSQSYVASKFGDINYFLFFTDDEGKYVTISEDEATASFYKYYSGSAEGFAVRYDCYDGGAEATVDPEAGFVSKLYEFTFSYEGQPFRWGGKAVTCIELKDAQGTVVATSATYDDQYEVTEGTSTWCKVTLNQEVTIPGTYYLVVPVGAFAIGEEYSAVGYKGQTVEYIVAESGIDSILGTEEQGDTRIYNLQGIEVTGRTLAPGIYIQGGQKILVK